MARKTKVKMSKAEKKLLLKTKHMKRKERKVIKDHYQREQETFKQKQMEKVYDELQIYNKRRQLLDEELDDEFGVDNEDILPTDMIDSDDELFQPKLKKPKVESSDDTIPEYEKAVRKFAEDDLSNDRRHLLPIKSAGGIIIPRSVKREAGDITEKTDVEDDSAELATKEPQKDESAESAEPAEPLTAIQAYLRKKELVNELKTKISSCCHSVIENPEIKINALKYLLELEAGECDKLITNTAIKLAMASLTEVFIDIIPGYRIRQLSEEEEKQRMTKEVKRLNAYENTLLRFYKKHLSQMEKHTSTLTRKNSKSSTDTGITTGILALRCFCSLLTSCPHFNFSTNILTVIAPLMSNRNETVRELACCAAESIFKNDNTAITSLSTVRAICKFVKKNFRTVHPRMLDTFLHLKIQKIITAEEAAAKKKEWVVLSKREKKARKKMKVLEKELKDVHVEQHEKDVLQMHTEIMNCIFTTYFKYLRDSQSPKLLSPVLQGLSLFAHLINVEFFDDLIAHLRLLLDGEELKPLEIIHCVKTALTVLSGEGHALVIDPHRFYVRLYSVLPKIIKEREKDVQLRQLKATMECLDQMINRRRKHITLATVAAFTKRLCQLCLLMDLSSCAATLLTIRSFFLSHAQLSSLLDDDEGGSGIYMAELEDPEHCNALSSTIIDELTLLSKCSKAEVRILASHLLHQLPSTGPHRLPPKFTAASPENFFPSDEKVLQDINSAAALESAVKRFVTNSSSDKGASVSKSLSKILKL